MVRRWSLLVLVIADAAWLALSVRLALGVDSWRRSRAGVPLDVHSTLHLLGITVAWLTALFVCGAYDRRYLALKGRNLSLTMFGCVVATAACAAGCYLAPFWYVSRTAFVALGLTAGLGLVLIRSVWLTIGKRVYLPEFLGVGDPYILEAVWVELGEAFGTKQPLPVVSVGNIRIPRSLAGIRDCPKDSALAALERHGSNLVVISDGTILSSQAAYILSRASLAGCTVADVFTYFERHTGRAPIFIIPGGWVFRPDHRAPDWAAYIGKRILDLLVTLLLLPLTIPVLMLAALLIRITSPGPVFFTQRRIGYRGRDFSLIKLRTMRIEETAGAKSAWTKHNDPRVTPIGRLLRATGIDELPQLWNVIRGDLSLVGPRPEQPEVISELDNFILPYMQRHAVPCGITGWAQIHRGSDAGLDDVLDKIRLDLYYARHFSLWFDIVILLRTFQMLLAGAKPAPSAVVGTRQERSQARPLRALAEAGSRT